jgi:hypothetical protein
MSGASPTQLTLRELRKDWPLVEVVERWNPHARIRQDLFGFVDVLAVGPAGVLGVQACIGSDVSTRVRKIADHPNVAAVREGGIALEVWGWKKNKSNRWEVRKVDVS